jgi:hypothetical protein
MMQATRTGVRVRENMSGLGSRRRSGPPAQGGRPRGRADSVLRQALELIEAGRPREADLLLTGEILCHPGDSELWLAAGIARAQRGCPASAVAALKMCRWLSGEPLAEELLASIG